MSSINSGMGNPLIPSSIAGSSASEKNSSAEKTQKADASAAKTVESANAEKPGLAESEKSKDRDGDGREFYESEEESPPPNVAEEEESTSEPTRSKDPEKKRGNRLDLDA